MNAMAIQAALKAAGFYTGEVDDAFGPLSLAARDKALEEAGVNASGWPHSRRMTAIRQWVLKRAGFDPGSIDGLEGPKTRAAEYEFTRPDLKAPLPWMREAEKMIGTHEKWDGDRLDAWLRSDGSSIGDAAAVPWCGDFVQTALKLGLKLKDDELPANPFAARQWADWGEDAAGLYGAIIVFWRGSRQGWQGHVGFVTAVDVRRAVVQVLGGNQANEVSRAWLGMDRILGWRAPIGWAGKMPAIGNLSSGATALSTNEG